MRPRIGIVDYGMGNRRSVQKALEHVGAVAPLLSRPDELAHCDGLVIPGVGAFPRAMESLGALGLVDSLRDLAGRGMPILGICLGMQLLFETSEELGHTAGLGLLSGEVRWLDTEGRRLPHIGWNEVALERSSPLTESLPAEGCAFYHVHSLAAHPRQPADVVGSTEYGERFATIVQRDNVAGVQFHPEKSSVHGLAMLRSFLAVCTGAPAPAHSGA